MKIQRGFASLFIVSSLVLLTATPAVAKDKWISVRTKGFNVVSNADSDDARRLALKLEQFRAVFAKLFKIPNVSPVPITVIAFRSDSSFKPFKPLYNGKPANVAGYFQRGEDENIIALNLASGEEHPLRVILHEYTHLLTAYNPREWPLWLNEGVAELYSTFDIKDKSVTFGIPVSNHVYLLRESKFVPLPALFNVTHGSPVYNERDKQSIFYAESWALAHYLMFGDKGSHHEQLVEFIKQYEAGIDLERAFTAAFKTDFATLEKNLRRYIGNNSYPGVTYTVDNTEGDKEISERPLAEAPYYLGNLLLHVNRLDEAEDFFNQALTLDASLPGPHEGLGVIATRRGRFSEAFAQLKEAVARGSKNHLTHYYYAEALHRAAMGGRNTTSGIPPDAARTIIAELKTSVSLMPYFAPAYNLMAFTELMTGEDLKGALQAARTAIQLKPQEKAYALTLAQIQMRLQDYDGAKKTLAPLLASEDQMFKGQAESLMSYIESYGRGDIGRSAPGMASVDGNAGPPAVEPGESQGKEPPRLKRRDEGEATILNTAKDASGGAARGDSEAVPTLKLAGTQVISGVLVGIECGNGMTLVFRSGGKLMRFAVSDPNALQFYAQDSSMNLQIGCGAMNLAAFIYYKPLTSSAGQLGGDAVAVEFTKPTK